jgi:hypothetical protein
MNIWVTVFAIIFTLVKYLYSLTMKVVFITQKLLPHKYLCANVFPLTVILETNMWLRWKQKKITLIYWIGPEGVSEEINITFNRSQSFVSESNKNNFIR